ncbi:MAG: hypothetical protein HPY90_12100 [Syntrophothermus sp.]|uniref:hypothetical protein n=1 Tax=Syntrophothermus sp. TaxID=2736299 RepID=UPI00257EC310|nr:hypothetical protein [Syntrophothermus sp.]NSW83991.1 hypothetical protein [Syntrophothermus sp.]
MKRFRDNEQGFISVLLLILIPLFIFSISATMNITNAVTAASVDLQEAVAVAAKAGAMQVDTTAQAKGLIRLRSDRAHDQFRKTLAGNLGLNETTLQPVGGQFAGTPKYWLLVYNGYSDYSPDAMPARLYYFNGTTVTASDLSYGGFPYTFSVSQSGITVGAGGAYTVEMTTPGVVAVVEIEATRLTGEKQIIAQRWAAARVVCKDGTCKVI